MASLCNGLPKLVTKNITIFTYTVIDPDMYDLMQMRVDLEDYCPQPLKMEGATEIP